MPSLLHLGIVDFSARGTSDILRMRTLWVQGHVFSACVPLDWRNEGNVERLINCGRTQGATGRLTVANGSRLGQKQNMGPLSRRRTQVGTEANWSRDLGEIRSGATFPTRKVDLRSAKEYIMIFHNMSGESGYPVICLT